jgi:DNA processing protein
MDENLKYKIGITLIPMVGDIKAKQLISYCGSAEAVFKEKKASLLKIPDIGEVTATAIVNQDILKRAEEEIKFIEKNRITCFYYLDKEYPLRLKQCNDNPIMLYYKGTADLNNARIISIVGTRMATSYGCSAAEELVKGLEETGALIVSGLAFGIDISAHRAAVKAGLDTIGVVAHGHDMLYPPEHANTAKKMVERGGILTEFLSGTIPDKQNFPKRNRIIAGLADAVVVVESKEAGGALITAEIAFSYNREVIAYPGRAEDTHSRGCNNLIQRNKAYLAQSSKDVIEYLGWKTKEAPKKVQQELFHNLNPEETAIVNVLKTGGEPMYIDDIAILSNLTPGNLSAHLLSLEFAGILKSLPGKMYTL